MGFNCSISSLPMGNERGKAGNFSRLPTPNYTPLAAPSTLRAFWSSFYSTISDRLGATRKMLRERNFFMNRVRSNHWRTAHSNSIWSIMRWFYYALIFLEVAFSRFFFWIVLPNDWRNVAIFLMFKTLSTASEWSKIN